MRRGNSDYSRENRTSAEKNARLLGGEPSVLRDGQGMTGNDESGLQRRQHDGAEESGYVVNDSQGQHHRAGSKKWHKPSIERGGDTHVFNQGAPAAAGERPRTAGRKLYDVGIRWAGDNRFADYPDAPSSRQ